MIFITDSSLEECVLKEISLCFVDHMQQDILRRDHTRILPGDHCREDTHIPEKKEHRERERDKVDEVEMFQE